MRTLTCVWAMSHIWIRCVCVWHDSLDSTYTCVIYDVCIYSIFIYITHECVTHMNQLCVWYMMSSYIHSFIYSSKSWLTCVWAMSHMCVSHVTHVCEPCHTCVWAMSHMCVSHRHTCVWATVTHVCEPCHTCVWDMSHIWINCVRDIRDVFLIYSFIYSFIYVPWLTNERRMAHIWMSHGSHTNDIWTWVISQI